MKLSVTGYMDALQESAPDLTPRAIQTLIEALYSQMATVDELYEHALSQVSNDEEAAVLETVKRDARKFLDRLNEYRLELVDCIITDRADDVECARPVVLPLLHGRFGNDMKMGGTPVCRDPLQCFDSVPDMATPVILLNQLDEFVEVQEEMWHEIVDLKNYPLVRALIEAGEVVVDIITWFEENLHPRELSKKFQEEIDEVIEKAGKHASDIGKTVLGVGLVAGAAWLGYKLFKK